MNDIAPDSRPFLNSPAARRPLWLLITFTLPQLLLMAYNLFAAWLVMTEMAPEEVQRYQIILASQGVLLAGVAAFAITCIWRKITLPWAAYAVLLAAHIAYLWTATALLGALFPASVTGWILRPERWIGYQYTALMPGMFFAAAHLASFRTPLSRGKDLLLSVATAVAVPSIAYIAIHLVARAFRFNFPETAFLVLLVLGTLVGLMAILRTFILLFDRFVLNRVAGLFVLTLFAALLLPIGGLLLNRSIPFPADFQSPLVYLFTVINALVLLMPDPASRKGAAVMLFLRALAFPFTFYFFAVFLPWLPLSLIAMIGAGAGFLILAPTVLFLVHVYKLRMGYQLASGGVGRIAAMLLLLGGVSILPAAYVGRALLERTALHQAMDYVFTADPVAESAFIGDRRAAKRVLENMQCQRQGIDLPYLSGFYAWLVFDGLVLPEERLKKMHRVLFGSEINETPLRTALWGTSRSGRGRLFQRTVAPLDAQGQARLVSVEWKVSAQSGVQQAEATLAMHNASEIQQEYVTRIHVPPGVEVTGYWLDIDGIRTPGRLFEKKTAEWIYRQIRNTRRDPGLVVYRALDQVELRVFPLEGNQTRTTGIQFTFPEGLHPALAIEQHSLPHADVPGPVERAWQIHGEAGTRLIWAHPPKEARVRRTPYLHFILDRSVTATETVDEQLARARDIATHFPEVPDGWVTYANSDVATPSPILRPIARMGEDVPTGGPLTAGFFLDRALQHALMLYHHQTEGPTASEWALRYPILVVIQGAATEAVVGEDLAPYAQSIPECAAYRVARGDQALTLVPIRNEPEQDEAVLARCGTAIRAAVIGADGSADFFFPGQHDSVEWIKARGVAQPMRDIIDLSGSGLYAEGSQAWLHWLGSYWQGGRIADRQTAAMNQARSAGVLIPSLSYVVVETDAQWKMLELTERQKLSGHQALEFSDAPEPTLWVLLLFLLTLWIRRKRKGAGLEGIA